MPQYITPDLHRQGGKSRLLARLFLQPVHSLVAFAVVIAAAGAAISMSIWQMDQQQASVELNTLIAHAASGARVLGVSTSETVQWTNVKNVIVEGGDIEQTSGYCTGCADAGANSAQQITSGDGYYEFTVATGTYYYVITGLNTDTSAATATSMNFALELSGAYATVRESTVYKADTTMASGDVFRIAVESGKVKYYKNGTLFYTSAATPSYPLVADVSMQSVGSKLWQASIAKDSLTITPPPTTTPPPTITPPPTTTPPPAITPPPTVEPFVNQKPVGFLDVINRTTASVVGWSKDPNHETQQNYVHIYFDKKPGSRGATAYPVLAGTYRSDVGSHGFVLPVPKQYIDGKWHAAYAYGIDLDDTTGASNILLTGSPIRFVIKQGSVTPPPPSTNTAPRGYVDGVDSTNNTVFGWAEDPDTLSLPIDVHMYFDVNAGSSGATAITCTANQSRTDLTTGNHAYYCPIPSQYIDGRQHQVWVWGIDLAGGTNTQLTNSPKSFTLGTTPTTTTIVDGYGDTLSATKFDGWFFSQLGDTSATITYENINDTTKTYTQTATRIITRTDAEQWLRTTYGTNFIITQPLGFSIDPTTVVTIPGTYRIKSFRLNASSTSISLGAGAQGTFTIAAPATLPTITSFGASPSSITSGQSSTLAWTVSGATALSIDQGVGAVTNTNSKVVSPVSTTTYTLTATNSSGSTSATTVLTVNSNTPAPVVSSSAELPRVYINTALANTPSNGQTITVAAGGNLQTALNNAQPGDKIVLAAGASYIGNFTLPTKTGNGWITITTSGFGVPEGVRVAPSNASSMAKILSNNTSPAIVASGAAHNYRFIGIEISLTAGAVPDANSSGGLTNYSLVTLGSSTETNAANLPHDVIFDRVYVHGSPTQNVRRGFFFNTGAVSVVDSYVSDFHEIGADSQALLGANGTGPYKVLNNYLEAAGENMMVGGLDVPLLPADFQIQGNYFYKPTKWMSGSSDYAGYAWVVKNLFETKFGLRWLINGNIFENNWPMGQTGMAINLKSSNQDGTMSFAETGNVTFTNNIVRHSTWAMSIHSKDTYSGGTAVNLHNVYIANNVFDDIGVWGTANTIQQDEVSYVTFDHNTFLNDRNNSAMALYGNPSTNFVFTNNIFGLAAYGIKGDGLSSGTSSISQYLPGSVFSKNVFYGANTSPYPSGNYMVSSAAGIGFTNYNNGNGGTYTLSSSSAYKNAGTDGKDIGADISALNTATARTLLGQ